MLKLVIDNTAPPAARPTMDQFVIAAMKKMEGQSYLPPEVEVDIVDGGAFVQAWIFVADKEAA